MNMGDVEDRGDAAWLIAIPRPDTRKGRKATRIPSTSLLGTHCLSRDIMFAPAEVGYQKKSRSMADMHRDVEMMRLVELP